MKTLYLHIGQHKTGSTSIQSFCKRNKKLFNKMGYEYPGNKGHHHGFYKTVVNEDNFNIVAYLKKLEKQKFEKFILSSEGFCKCSRNNIENLASVLKRLKWDVQIVVYLRRQDKAIESIYTQMLKNQKIKISIDEYVKRSKFKNLQYGKFLDSWSEVFGKENIKILLFDKVKLGLLKSFLRSIGFKKRERMDQFTYLKNKKNAKPSAVEIKNLLKTNGIAGEIYKQVSYSLISPQDAALILKKFEEENRYVAKTYFNSANLF